MPKTFNSTKMLKTHLFSSQMKTRINLSGGKNHIGSNFCSRRVMPQMDRPRMRNINKMITILTGVFSRKLE
jgi:hypothetical protein